MISEKEIQDKNLNLAMSTKESPAMDLTRMIIGYTPRSKFKQGYMSSTRLSNAQLQAKIESMTDRAKPRKIIPYMYDARRRGVPLPENTLKRYNQPDEKYLRELNLISAVPAEQYVNAGVTGAAALTGVAALDYLAEKVTPKHKLVAEAINKGKAAPEAIKNRILGPKVSKAYTKAFETNMSTLVGKDSPAKAKLMERTMGLMHNFPLAGVATLPLLSRDVLKKLKGDEKGSKRDKVFTWIENHPTETMGMAFAPTAAKRMTSGAVDLVHTIKHSPSGVKNKLVGASLARTGIGVGNLGLTMAMPLIYMKMVRHMGDARAKEKELIDSTIIKNNTREQ